MLSERTSRGTVPFTWYPADSSIRGIQQASRARLRRRPATSGLTIVTGTVAGQSARPTAGPTAGHDASSPRSRHPAHPRQLRRSARAVHHREARNRSNAANTAPTGPCPSRKTVSTASVTATAATQQDHHEQPTQFLPTRAAQPTSISGRSRVGGKIRSHRHPTFRSPRRPRLRCQGSANAKRLGQDNHHQRRHAEQRCRAVALT